MSEPIKLAAKDCTVRDPRRGDAPGCCGMAATVIEFRHKQWSIAVARTTTRLRYAEACYCPFCGQKLAGYRRVLKQL